MRGRVVGLARHPVKGFTPEPLSSVTLRASEHFPGDRLFAVEDGPSGFDPDNPVHISKTAFTVLARLPQVAEVRTRWNEDESTLTASHPDLGEITTDMEGDAGRSMFATWLSAVLGDAVRGPLKVLAGPGGFRFTDSRTGFVSIINLESVRDLEAKLGKRLDPARFRGNVMIKPIVRCTATHVDPQSARTDIDVVKALFDHYGHVQCGIYCRTENGGPVAIGDTAAAL